MQTQQQLVNGQLVAFGRITEDGGVILDTGAVKSLFSDSVEVESSDGCYKVNPSLVFTDVRTFKVALLFGLQNDTAYCEESTSKASLYIVESQAGTIDELLTELSICFPDMW